jgi:pentatricopeptide repeat protein
MINSYCKMNLLREACGLFEDMKTRGIKPDVVIYTIMINSYCKMNWLRGALDLYDEMSLKGMKPGATLNRRIQKARRMQFHQ